MKARAEHLSGRSGHAAEEIGAYEEELARLDQKVAGLSAEDRQLRRAFTESEMRYYDAERLRQEMASRIEVMQQKVLEARGEVERRTARMDFLQGLIDSREGLPEGVRFLSSTEQWERMQTVADALHAEERLRPALEAALGDFAGCIIVQHAAEALEAVRLLKEGEHGKATFICLDRIPAITSRCALPAGSGVVGWAASLATFDKNVAPLFRFLFDRVLIVETQEAARRVAALMPGVRCVTLDGELESGAGLSRGGSRRYDEGGMIGKRAQMTDLQSEVRQLQQALEQLEAEREAVQREHDAIDLKALNDAVKAVEKEMNGVEMRIAQMEFEKKRAADIVSRNREEIAAIEAEAAALRSEIEGSIPGLEALTDEKTGVERSYGASAAGLEALEREWNDRSTAARDLGIAVVRARNELENARSALDRAELQTDELHIAIARHKADAVTAGESIAGTEAHMAEHEAALDALQGEFSALLAVQSAAEKQAAAVRGESHRIELAIRDQRRLHDDTLRDLHEHELQLQDLRAKTEHLTARAREEFELTLERKAYPDDAFVDFAALRDEVPALRDKIKSLGNINFAAFEEYTGEKQRYETLSVQRQDLLEAEKNLLATIEEINTTAQNQFLETFGKIRTNFIDTFKSLFDPGDECDLKLEDEVDPLEARIEIVAKPRGKRPTSIDLLSGGEKTLTAIALLFAIYLVKPSPFCILDEVDAPLDDANIDRFTRIIRKFSNNTQFIVVTHNKRTMESANAMYGVTMEEEGVSKIVTVRFNQGGMAQSAALAAG
jgi:chromosome segregation protein